METTARLYQIAAQNIYLQVNKRIRKNNTDTFDFVNFSINKPELEWIRERNANHKYFLQPIYDVIADRVNRYDPCYIPRCPEAYRMQQTFSDAMEKLHAHREARDIIIKKKHQYIVPSTQLLSRDGFTAETAAARDNQGMRIVLCLLNLLSNQYVHFVH